MNPFELLRNGQALKEQAEKIQEEMKNITATGSAGGKMVTVTLNGKFEVLNVFIDPLCADPRDTKMLEDLVKAAHHDALEKIQEQMKDRAGSLMNGLNLSGLGL